MKSIYISICSYLDTELYGTVEDLLIKSSKENNLFLCVYSQDSSFPDLELLCNKYKAELVYIKINYKHARGTVHARKISQMFLEEFYDYYLQVDSHTLFKQNWDSLLIDQYEKSKLHFGKIIFSTYPWAYKYENNKAVLKNQQSPISLIMKKIEDYWKYVPNYKEYEGNEYGEPHGYYCGGFVFSDSKNILEVPWDDNLYMNGEEITMSIRFSFNNTLIIAPPENYVYHNYVGHEESTDKRKRIYDVVYFGEDESLKRRLVFYENRSEKRVKDFFSGIIKDMYGVPRDYYLTWESKQKFKN